MKWFLVILMLLIAIQNGEGIVINFPSLLKDFKSCVGDLFSKKVEMSVSTVQENSTFKFGILFDHGDLVEEDTKVLSQEILLNYPDQEELNDGPSPLEVEMNDEVYFRKSNTSEDVDILVLGNGHVMPEVPKDKLKKVKEMTGEKTKSKRKYTLAPYTRAYVRSMIVRQKVAYIWMQPVYIYGSLPMYIGGGGGNDLTKNPKWKQCGNGQQPLYFLSGKTVIDVGNMITDPDIATDDGELVFYLRHRTIVEEEKVVMMINAQEMTDKKNFAYKQLCRT